MNISQKLDLLYQGKITMTEKELEALIDHATKEELEIIFRHLVEIQKLK